MNIKDKSISPTRKSKLIDFNKEEILIEEQSVLVEFIQHVRIPGFRAGKASEKMVRSRYSKDIIKELKQRLVQKAHQESVSNGSDRIYSIIETSCNLEDDFNKASVQITIDIVPEFELPNYLGISVKTKSSKADEKEIDQMISHILGQRAEFKPVEKVIEKGDYVRCGYSGKINGELIDAIAPNEKLYGTQKATWEEAGADNSPGVKAVVDGLIGMEKGGVKEVEMEFQSDFKIHSLAGKKAVYEISVEEVREKILPEMNEAFYKSMQVADEDEFRSQISQTIEQRKKNEISNANQQQIIDHLIEFVKVPLPESGLESERDKILKDFMQKNLQAGVAQENFEKNKESLHESASNMAVPRLKSYIVLEMIAEKESISVNNDDLSRAIVQQASMLGQKPEVYVKQLKKDRSEIENLKRDIKIGKTLNFLLEKADIQNDDEENTTKSEKHEAKD